MSMTIRAATRGSALARWQTDHVAALLRQFDPTITVEPVVVETRADLRLDIPIWEMGGKGVFVKEVQAAVLDGRADIAVHSGKDLPSASPPELTIAAVPARADARDVLVGAGFDELVPGAVVATGSVRRRAQLAWLRPDLTFTGLRGNIATRLDRIPAGGSIVMAAAALDRLELWPELERRGLPHSVFEPDVVLPQVAQGALAIECRVDDEACRSTLAAIEDDRSRVVFTAERAFLDELGGDCDLPAGAHAHLADGELVVRALLASLDGHTVMRTSVRGPLVDADRHGRSAARRLLDDAGGRSLLER
jgi:hydroxymethylbilane synthase